MMFLNLAIKRFFSLFWILAFAYLLVVLVPVKHDLIKVAKAQMQQQMGPFGMQQQMEGMQQQMGMFGMQQQQFGMQQSMFNGFDLFGFGNPMSFFNPFGGFSNFGFNPNFGGGFDSFGGNF